MSAEHCGMDLPRLKDQKYLLENCELGGRIQNIETLQNVLKFPYLDCDSCAFNGV